MATGLLVILVGPFTRLEPFLSSSDKTYEAQIRFGSATDTDDAEGAVVEELPVATEVLDPSFAATMLESLIGDSLQHPPQYSAIKLGGQTAHRVARSGGRLELAPRPVTVHEAVLLRVDPDTSSWDVRLRVSKGTYIRSIARDLGRSTGCVAHLSELRRTTSGTLKLADAVTLEELAAAGARACFIDPVAALGLPTIVAEVDYVSAGRPLPRPDDLVAEIGAHHAVVDRSGLLLAVYSVAADALKPLAVFPRLGSATEATS
jgi:tRNA pseudouridine55 synthase